MRDISCTEITDCVRDMFIKANTVLPEDVAECIDCSAKCEKNARAKEILGLLSDNARIAAETGIPICQDTGMAFVFVKLGQEVSEKKVDQVLERVGIVHLADRRVGGEKSELSGGECQKIAIARALLRNAEVLILDEPTNHLDEAAKQWLMDFVRNFDQTMIYVSHEESMIQLADRKIAVQR